MWTDDWIGLPYAELGRGPGAYDCLGLWLALQRARFGREVPDPECRMGDALRRGTVDRYRSRFARVTAAAEGDLLLFLSAGRPLHVGFALDNQDMIHIDAFGGSRVERWRGMRWLGKLEGIYRLA
ncbi:NlpC/P60 family protein [Salipiger mangrovisoli]|uniref:C40 family peptidase n=1 Tax=Salipiger mangrovisoli TaxID=2865933 RepID=A0ABR9WWY2_9RHOB|nr:NlpC/P60 family protein [Salipiger mangrovisoli]MBE9635784.1 C40 family peptidase [Salipiger mangrovisoli]